MTTATPALSAAPNPGYLVGQVWPTTRYLLRTVVFLAAWFWGIVVSVVVVATVVVAVVSEPNISILALARHGAIWFPFSVYIIVSATYLPIHVATGLTRRSLSHGAIVTAVLGAALYGGVFSALLLVERAIYDAAGWRWRFFDDLSADAPPSTFIPGLLLTFLVAYQSGLLIGMAYQRGRAFWGTVTLPLTAGPVLLVSALFVADTGPFDTETWFGGRGLSTQLAVAASLAIAAAMAFAFDRLARGASVRVRTS